MKLFSPHFLHSVLSSFIQNVNVGVCLYSSDIEPSIEPDYTMATSVEACPPRMEDFVTVSNDEGLSSPGSDEFPQKSPNQDHIYNDSGIIFGECLQMMADDSAMHENMC